MEQRKGDYMDFLDLLKQRRSYRQYTGEPVEKELLDKIVEAGLLAPSGRNIKPEELIVVTDSKLLTQLSQCRKAGSQMLEGAGACIIVLGDEDKTDVWVEDCSNVILTMHYMASSPNTIIQAPAGFREEIEYHLQKIQLRTILEISFIFQRIYV